MKQRTLGRSGLLVSEVGLGCNNFGMRLDNEASARVVHKALDLGITLFDTAESYSNGRSEEALGLALGARRPQVAIATKWNGSYWGPASEAPPERRGGSRREVMRAVEASLKRLGTDYIDLYQLHRPDPATPIEETLRALEDAIRQGKVRYAGVSNMPAWQVVEAQMTARLINVNRFVSCQDHYSLLERGIERDLVPAMQAHGLGLLPYFPLANGMLTGKYRRDAAPPEGTRLAGVPAEWRDRSLSAANFDLVEKLTAFALTRGHTILELAFAWLLARPPVGSVIAGATSPEQVAQNVAAAGWLLAPDEVAEVDRLSARGG